MLEPRSSVNCPTDRPVVRVKVVPASFGLDGFEDAVWEATEGMMGDTSVPGAEMNGATKSNEEGWCRATTFVVAAPDLFNDSSLVDDGGEEGGGAPPRTTSPQAEFEPGSFREFSDSLGRKLDAFSRAEGLPGLSDAVKLTSFHPLWRDEGSEKGVLCGGDGGDGSEGGTALPSCRPFPYPCIAVSARIES